MDELLRYEESAELWREKVEELIESDPDAARSMLGLSSDAYLELSEPLLRRGAWVGMLTRAIEVRCTQMCDHAERYAYMRFGLLCCEDCIESRFAEVKPRKGDDCDICGAHADPFVPIEHKIAEASIFVLAKACVACGELNASLQLPPGPSLNLN